MDIDRQLYRDVMREQEDDLDSIIAADRRMRSVIRIIIVAIIGLGIWIYKNGYHI